MTPAEARSGLMTLLAMAAAALPASAAPARPVRFERLSLEHGLSQRGT